MQVVGSGGTATTFYSLAQCKLKSVLLFFLKKKTKTKTQTNKYQPKATKPNPILNTSFLLHDSEKFVYHTSNSPASGSKGLVSVLRSLE